MLAREKFQHEATNEDNENGDTRVVESYSMNPTTTCCGNSAARGPPYAPKLIRPSRGDDPPPRVASITTGG